MRSHEQQQALQRDYYARTAPSYDSLHHSRLDEHHFALAMMCGAVELFGYRSILDIGSGTGRALVGLRERFPGVRIVGIEPSPDLRAVGHAKGIAPDELIDGDARALPFSDGEFDLVCEFGALHHIPRPELAVGEMLRVARRAVFLSDSNKYGQGSAPLRLVKALVEKLRLWPAFDYLRTGGKGYMESEGDGLFYSYSLFDNHDQLRDACRSVHVLNTQGDGTNSKRGASHVAMLGLKEDVIAGA